MTIQIRTTQIPTILILKKYLNDYISISNINLRKIKIICVDLINIYKPLFSFFQNLKYFSRYFKIIKNNYVFFLY